tara:strand:- start:347 stop:1594 length:1248 start_codon:yes stop_codon:yes gene_type:complete
LFLSAGCSDFFNPTIVEEVKGPSSDLPNPFEKETGEGSNPFPKDFDPNAGTFSEAKMLANIGLNVIFPEARNFRVEVEALKLRLSEYCQDLQSMEPLKTQWKNAMKAYHKLAAIPVGPLAENDRLAMAYLYSWPSANSCGVDVQVEKMSRIGKIEGELIVSVKGLDALEYLIFEDQLQSTCNLNSPLFRKVKDWVERPESEKRKDRCAFSKHLMSEIESIANWLESSWDPQKRNFSKELYEGKGFSSVHEAVNAVSDAMFAIEEVKDERLGVPLGLHSDCTADQCPERVEHPWSQSEWTAIEQRVLGFEAVYFGGYDKVSKHFGFDDFLNSSGHGAVASSLKEKFLAVEALLKDAKAQGPLTAQVQASSGCGSQGSPEKLCQLFWAVKNLSSSLKLDLLSALSLKAPPVYQGDND